MNAIRRLSDYRSTSSTNTNEVRNGSNYLLTSMTLFVTHEPCIMCSMALLHSRVKQVIYLIPMEKTGGCGSLACLPKLDGVNHRFGICRWKDEVDVRSLDIDPRIDV
jgi:tRNA-specific adenosine deaminase 3